ncbi:hypothetical protein Agabi119p4_1332 [Agaricus bisporus var. burnettii]|uniref:Uncharacterized protein n=1 Tax=Agaricus bisporus var. burnettii TaxID=192524 RepID=A0A8H7FC91_AGABI|nr:hypothetical protein Agabi119p4_1332 [Agaricus bisporus var. burnettii]
MIHECQSTKELCETPSGSIYKLLLLLCSSPTSLHLRLSPQSLKLPSHADGELTLIYERLNFISFIVNLPVSRP